MSLLKGSSWLAESSLSIFFFSIYLKPSVKYRGVTCVYMSPKLTLTVKGKLKTTIFIFSTDYAENVNFSTLNGFSLS